MEKVKIQDYHLNASIHTVAVKSEGIVENIGNDVAACIKISSVTKGSKTTTSIINPNNLQGDIFRFSDFEKCLNVILQGSGISDYKVVRADLRLDSYDSKHYRVFQKLNRYLISALAVTYKIKNCYRTTDLFTQQQLSVAIKNKYFECENYDKEVESEGRDPAKSRLEERTKAWVNKDFRREFCQVWFRRWNKAVTNLAAVQERYNFELDKIYKESLDVSPCKFRSVTDFLIQYQDCIFTRSQLVNLIERIEGISREKAEEKASNHRKRYGIQYFYDADVRAAVNEIKRATLEFFDN